MGKVRHAGATKAIIFKGIQSLEEDGHPLNNIPILVKLNGRLISTYRCSEVINI